MKCPSCGAENREGSNFCRYCAARLTTSGYIPSVPPPPPAEAYNPSYPPLAFETPPTPPARVGKGQLVCPRCGSTNVIKGGIPTWAIIAAVVGFLVVLCFSLLFLLVKEPHRCVHCGLEFK